MTTSGTTSLAYTVNEIFEEALDECGVIGDGETITGNHFARCKKAANLLLKEWGAEGNHLWTKKTGYLFVTKGTASYDFASARLVTEYTKTSTSAAASTGANTITVDSVTGIADTDVIGVLLEDNTIQWTTVNGAPAGSVVTLTANLTDDVNSGAAVFHYSATDSFPAAERLRSVRRIDSSDYEIPLDMYSRSQYENLPNKTEQSTPVVAYADRQRDAITLYLWPTPNTEEIVIPVTYERKIEVVTASTETWDIPEYWFNALSLNIARRVARKFGVGGERLATLDADAMSALDIAKTFDTEITDIRFTI